MQLNAAKSQETALQNAKVKRAHVLTLVDQPVVQTVQLSQVLSIMTLVKHIILNVHSKLMVVDV